MVYKIFYVEDLQSESRKSDIENLGFEVMQYDPKRDINVVIDEIKQYNPDIIIMDYRLNSGSDTVYYDAPTIAATLRNKHCEGFIEIPIILISNENKITDFYKDFLNQDLFDYAIEKQVFTREKEEFKRKVISFKKAYDKIKDEKFDICKILNISEEDRDLIHSLIYKKLELKKGFIYENSRFINDNLIYAIGALIGEDVLAARLGIDKKCKDWPTLLEMLNHIKYTGIFSDAHNRWWAEKLEKWWVEHFSKNNLRRLNASERVEKLNEKFQLELIPAKKSELSKSHKFWSICKGSYIPLDPFDGIQIIKKDYKIWQEKEYLSKEYALSNLPVQKDYIDDVDLKYLRENFKRH